MQLEIFIHVALLTVLTSSGYVLGFRCKWSNEGCESNEECCSNKCLQGHPGTNYRCTASAVHGPCLYNHQCDSSLVCVQQHKCCVKMWDTCITDSDCCSDPNYICVPAKGFIYDRCLYSEITSYASDTASRLYNGAYMNSLAAIVLGISLQCK